MIFFSCFFYFLHFFFLGFWKNLVKLQLSFFIIAVAVYGKNLSEVDSQAFFSLNNLGSEHRLFVLQAFMVDIIGSWWLIYSDKDWYLCFSYSKTS